jgi:hypothetical protein
MREERTMKWKIVRQERSKEIRKESNMSEKGKVV